MPTPLKSLQRMFAESLETSRRPVLAHLQVSPGGPAHASTRAIIDRVDDGQASSETSLRQRIDLYRSSIRAHRRAALANAYPVLLSLVGDIYFDALSHAYAREHPSQSGDLNRFGAALPAFIERYETAPRFRYFADLARLEWSLHLACFAADADVLTPQQWAAIRPDELLDAKLAVHPACSLITSRYAIAGIWTAHQPDGRFPTDLDSSTYALIVRPHWRPQILVQSAAAHAAFAALQRGATLDEALDTAFGIDAEFNFTSQWRAWIAASAITGLAERTPRPRYTLAREP